VPHPPAVTATTSAATRAFINATLTPAGAVALAGHGDYRPRSAATSCGTVRHPRAPSSGRHPIPVIVVIGVGLGYGWGIMSV
jgi:hypothetical protein